MYKCYIVMFRIGILAWYIYDYRLHFVSRRSWLSHSRTPLCARRTVIWDECQRFVAIIRFLVYCNDLVHTHPPGISLIWLSKFCHERKRECLILFCSVDWEGNECYMFYSYNNRKLICLKAFVSILFGHGHSNFECKFVGTNDIIGA